jgi:Restriction endonuclease
LSRRLSQTLGVMNTVSHPASASPKEKGDSLEDAVRAIEDSILRSAPGFAQGTFRIQQKRIVQSTGVRHEIDLFVTASLATGYEATFIFECKNWQSKVGKNEIIVFAEKVAVVGAQRGFFVARAFTRDARAQAAKDSRLELLVASHVQPVVRMQFPQFIHTAIGKTDVHVQFGFAGVRPALSPNLDEQIMRVADETMLARDYVNTWADKVRHEHVRDLKVSDMPGGAYTVHLSAERHFPEGEAYLNDVPLRRIELRGTAEVTIVRAAVLSIFEVATRGRLLKIGVDHGGIEMRADIVELAQ